MYIESKLATEDALKNRFKQNLYTITIIGDSMPPNNFARLVKNIYSAMRMMVIKRRMEKYPEPKRSLENGKRLNIKLDKLPPKVIKNYYGRPFFEPADPEIFLKKYKFDKTGNIPLFE